ncbi:MAG TPA: hypothetical protein VKY81_11440 [Natronosporangium sp.]|nr:hypothetical protein [Natronosporangium sp.]
MATALVELLAQNNFGNTRSGSLAGPVGGFIIAALAVVTVLLIRDMNARLRRLPDRFPDQTERPDRNREHSDVEP